MFRRAAFLGPLFLLVAVLLLGAVRPGGIQLLGNRPYPGGIRPIVPGDAPAPAELDSGIILFTFNPQLDPAEHNDPAYQTWYDEADTIIDLSDLANDFCWGMVDKTFSNSRRGDYDNSNGRWRQILIPWEGVNTLRWNINQENPVEEGMRHEMVYIDFDRFVPDNTSIVKAFFGRVTGSTAYWGDQDTLSATLMTSPTDNAWHTSYGVTRPTHSTHFSHMTWDYQISGLTGDGYPGPGTDVLWDPPLDERQNFWDYGTVTDWTGNSLGNLVGNTGFEQDITDIVQAIKGGAVNNGIMTCYGDWQQAAGSFQLYSWENELQDTYSYCVVKYLTKPYLAPMPNGKDIAVCFQTDDGNNNFNHTYADTMEAYGGKFSMFITGNTAGDLDDDRWILGYEAVDFFERGVCDVGSHSAVQYGNGVWLYYGDDLVVRDYEDGMYPALLGGGATNYDKLLYDTDPEFLYYLAEQEGKDFRGELNYGKSFGIPVGQWSPDAQMAFAHHRDKFNAIRVLSVNKLARDSDNKQDFRAVAQRRVADSDSAYGAYRPNRMRQPRPLQMLANSHGTSDIAGGKTTFLTEEEVKHRFRGIIEDVRASDRRYIGFLEHDYKTNPQGEDYIGGMDPIELSYMCQVMQEYDNPYVTLSELGKFLTDNATAVATPASYAIPDSFKHAAEDRIYYIQNGYEDRILRAMTPMPEEVAQIQLENPVYGCVILANEPDIRSKISTVAENDIVLFQQEFFTQAQYVGFTDDVRELNPDFIPCIYFQIFGIRPEWEGSENYYGAYFDMVERNDFYMRYLGGEKVRSGWVPVQVPTAYNLDSSNPVLADSLVTFFLDRMEETDNLRHGVAVLLDWFNSPYPESNVYSDSLQFVDMDQDGIPWYDDNEEQYNIDFNVGLVNLFRQRASERGFENFLVLGNTNGWYKSAYASNFDGGMFEDFQLYYPSGDGQYSYCLDTLPTLLPRDRINHPLIWWYAQQDSVGYPTESIGTIGSGIAMFARADGLVTAPDRRLDLGVRDGKTFSQSGGLTSCEFDGGPNGRVKCWFEEQPPGPMPWPYLIEKIPSGEVISVGGGWVVTRELAPSFEVVHLWGSLAVATWSSSTGLSPGSSYVLYQSFAPEGPYTLIYQGPDSYDLFWLVDETVTNYFKVGISYPGGSEILVKNPYALEP